MGCHFWTWFVRCPVRIYVDPPIVINDVHSSASQHAAFILPDARAASSQTPLNWIVGDFRRKKCQSYVQMAFVFLSVT